MIRIASRLLTTNERECALLMMWFYDIGYRFFFLGKRMRKRHPRLEKLCRKYEYYFSLLVNRKIAPWMEAHPVNRCLNTGTREERYTISLTSFPARINYVHLTIDTLMRQNFKPDNIVLWLAESQFPDKKLPEKLTALQDKGLTIRWCDNLRSHKKYHYVFQEYPNDNIILADDDVFYPRDMLATLVKHHKKHPKDIIATTAVLIEPAISSLPSVWVRPVLKKRYVSSQRIQPYSGQGTLYPAKWYPQELFNKEKAIAMAGSADDMWLHAMSILAGVGNTLVHPQRGFPVNVEIKNDQPLFHMNNNDGQNLNDRAWAALVSEYGLDDCDRLS